MNRSKHTIQRVFRSRRILLVDGDQIKMGAGNRDFILSRYGEVHVFRNRFNQDIQQRQEVDATWCRYHDFPKNQKEAVDHYITFFCGSHFREWKTDNVSVTILSKDASFYNTKTLLEINGVECSVIQSLPIQKKEFRKRR